MADDKHPGFEKAADKIAERYGGNKKKARAILASATRKASDKAKKANPNLLKVKGKG